MRQLPANSNPGATSSTENSRSRSRQANDPAGVKTLCNGSVKEPILTRSKSRLRVGRRLSGRSPKKPASPPKSNDTNVDGVQRRKPDKGTSSSSRQSSSSSSSPKNDGVSTERSPEKMYARHYKSYRGLNGIKSRRGERSTAENRSHCAGKNEGSIRDSRRANNHHRSVSRSHLRRNIRKNHVTQNGTGPSPEKIARSPSNRIRQLMALKRKAQLSRRRGKERISSESSSPQLSPKDDGSDLSSRKDKAGKRRSALWVLNCEAESFLFGETAADKHEVELPPLAPPSPPPKKRRKWRVTELAHLLEKSPILESKLRKSSSSESGSDMQRDTSPPKKRLKPEAQRATRRVKNLKHREKTPELCSTSTSKPDKPDKGRNHEQVLSPRPELLSPIPFLYSPDSIDHEAKTVQFRQMLENVNWGYSFEQPPVNETWYPAFSRSEDSIVPYSCFVSPLHEPPVLPYEMDKPLRRSRCKPTRNSRKSPRCHASTLAILSSERPTRSTRSSVTLEASSPPSSTVNTLQPESTLSAMLLTVPPPPPPNPRPMSPNATATTHKFSPPKCIPLSSRRRHLSSPKASSQQNDSKKELGAAQYLWDSIQFLSDPYVVTLLAGEDPDAVPEQVEHPKRGAMKNHRCNNNNNYVINNCPVKHMVRNLETSARKASLRSGDGSATTGVSVNSSNNLSNSRLVSVPKCSPRLNHSHGTNNHFNVTSPPVSPTATVNDRVVSMNGVTRRFTSRSPPLSPPTKQAVCQAAVRLSPKNSKGSNSKQSKSSKGGSGSEGGDNGLIPHDKSSKNNSSIILVADLYSATTKSKINSWEEESLFNGDGLPPLPSWPV